MAAIRKIDGSDVWVTHRGSELDIHQSLLAFGVWIHPEWFKRLPHITPFAVRDASSRSKANPEGKESWGSPNSQGYFRDDNSLIKEWVKSLSVISPHSYYDGARLASGFVACHVWRGEHGDGLMHGDPILNSFIPNLVWLPKSIARASDVVGSETQRILQATARKIYSGVGTATGLSTRVQEAWANLPAPAGDPIALEPSSLSFFDFDQNAYRRRLKSLEGIVHGLRGLIAGESVKKIYSKRYLPGLVQLPASVLRDLVEFLEPYLGDKGPGTPNPKS